MSDAAYLRWRDEEDRMHAAPVEDASPAGQTAFELAWEAAEQRQAEEAAREAQRERSSLAAVEEMVYDPRPAPVDTRMYQGTGVGALYGIGGSCMAWVVPDLCDAPAGMVERSFDLAEEAKDWLVVGVSA